MGWNVICKIILKAIIHYERKADQTHAQTRPKMKAWLAKAIAAQTPEIDAQFHDADIYRSYHLAPLRNKDTAKTHDFPPAAYTFVEVVHGKGYATVVAETETTARPDNDRPRRALADNAVRPITNESAIALNFRASQFF
jgi:hypothetical protein